MAGVLELTADNWDMEVVHGTVPVLVEFWAPGCGPCQKMLPVLDSVAQRFAGRAKVAKVDITEEYDLANEYGVQSVPRFLLFHRNRKPSQQIIGATSELALDQLLSQAVGSRA